jgi:hypothetical protein
MPAAEDPDIVATNDLLRMVVGTDLEKIVKLTSFKDFGSDCGVPW